MQENRPGCLDASEVLYLCNSKNLSVSEYGFLITNFAGKYWISFMFILIWLLHLYWPVFKCRKNTTSSLSKGRFIIKLFTKSPRKLKEKKKKTDSRPALSNTGATCSSRIPEMWLVSNEIYSSTKKKLCDILTTCGNDNILDLLG